MKAVVISIGDELVLGQNVDTNSAWISSRLARYGVMTLYHETVADDVTASEQSIRRAASAAQLVIVTGGLGPTQDDLTREALARVLNVPLDLHEDSLIRIEQFFLKIGRPMAVSNRVQAMYPRGTEVLANDWGTAPGILADVGQAKLFAFPGVPREMISMFECYVEPGLADKSGRTILAETLRTFGAGESSLAEKLGDLMRRDRNPTVGTTASGGVITVRIRSDFSSKVEAERELAATVLAVEQKLGSLIFGRGDVSLAQVVLGLLRRQGKTLGTAEIFTGGLLAGMIADTGAVEHVYHGGWVVGSGSHIAQDLGIDDVIRKHGLTSEHVARRMAEQVLLRAGPDYALAVGGFGGDGIVRVALASGIENNKTISVEQVSFPREVGIVQDRVAKTALNMLRLELLRGGQ